MDWFNVKDGNPMFYGRYLVVCKGIDTPQIRLYEGNWDSIAEVTHWMELPKMPKDSRIKEGDICKFGVPDIECDVLVTLGSGNPKDGGCVKGVYLNGHNKGNIGLFNLKELRKTGKHFELDEILKE